jgi:sec-independent protein translocase protein TatB
MLDIGFSELLVIGVVALIVIGPERLPRVARTAGHLLGRFQRYVADVKADINREIELADLKKLQSSVEDAARSFEQSVKSGVEDAQKEFKDAQTALENTGAELKKTGDEVQQTMAGLTMPHMGMGGPGSTVPTQAGTEVATSAPAGLIAPTAGSNEGAAAGETITADDEGPSPQLELGLDPSAQPAAQKQA